MLKFEDLKGQTLTSITGDIGDNVMHFTTINNKKYKLFNREESYGNDVQVTINDIIGDLSDLINHPILLAEGITDKPDNYVDESFRWTFYKLSTIKGSVTIRWCGRSNGCYSEKVDFCKLL